MVLELSGLAALEGVVAYRDIADTEAIAAQVGGVRAVAPQTSSGAMAVYGARNWATVVYGTITSVKEDRFVIRMSETAKVEVGKSFISTVVKRADAA